MILLSSPLKYDPPENMVSIFFFLEIEIVTNEIVNSKSLKNLSSASVYDQRPQILGKHAKFGAAAALTKKCFDVLKIWRAECPSPLHVE